MRCREVLCLGMAYALAACGSESDPTEKTDSAVNAVPVECPAAPQSAPPSGACTGSGSCLVSVYLNCPDGGAGMQKLFDCECTGTWSCQQTGQTLGFCGAPPQDAGTPD